MEARRPGHGRGRWYAREGTGLEFERLAFFTDAVFAIAMTLLVVGIAIPALHAHDSGAELVGALRSRLPSFLCFFIGFAVLGNYWVAHHRFFANMKRIDGQTIGINLLYLAFIAVLPFPTGLLGQYLGNPVAVTVFALNAGAISLCEAVLLWHGYRTDSFSRELPAGVFTHALVASLVPVALFVTSIPLAFVRPYLGIVWWFVALPIEAAYDRRKPQEFDEYFR